LVALVYNARAKSSPFDQIFCRTDFRKVQRNLDAGASIKAVRLTECSAGASGAAPEEKQSGRAKLCRPPEG
jgi:hypothetical protein